MREAGLQISEEAARLSWRHARGHERAVTEGCDLSGHERQAAGVCGGTGGRCQGSGRCATEDSAAAWRSSRRTQGRRPGRRGQLAFVQDGRTLGY